MTGIAITGSLHPDKLKNLFRYREGNNGGKKSRGERNEHQKGANFTHGSTQATRGESRALS
jgi:hypothetical protein